MYVCVCVVEIRHGSGSYGDSSGIGISGYHEHFCKSCRMYQKASKPKMKSALFFVPNICNLQSGMMFNYALIMIVFTTFFYLGGIKGF